jgi:ATP-dependent Lon protease
MNIPLFVLDFIILLPITLIRLFIIYLYGSRYNVDELKFLDVMMHSENKFFNGEIEVVDTIRDQTVSFKSHDKNYSHVSQDRTDIYHNDNHKIFLKDTITDTIETNSSKIKKEISIKEEIEQIKNNLDSITDNSDNYNSDNEQQTIKLDNIETTQQDDTINFLFTEN